MAAVLLTLVASAAYGQAYPVKPIRLIVPYLAGGTTDLVARTVGEHMARKLGQPVIIDNRTGAGGNIGMDVVAKAPPDGYVIGLGAMSTNALNPHVYRKMPFDPRSDFTALGMLGYSTIVLEVGPALPVKNVQEFIAYARRNPGLQFGTGSAGSSMHLAGAMFAQMAGLELVHVPYKGSVPGIADMLGGHLPAMFDNLPASLPQIQAGKLKALAVAGKHRSSSLPEVPTMAEAGLPGYEVEPWFGLYGPAGMNPSVVRALNQALREALEIPAVKALLEKDGFTPTSSTPEELETLTRSEYVRLGKLAASAKLSAD